MESLNYILDFPQLCMKYGLGQLTETPEPVSGGFLHKMYRIVTSQAEYAVKALNPQIMLRPAAMGNIIFAEKVANLARSQGINALPAIESQGSCMHEVQGQYYLLFPWMEGKALPAGAVDMDCCTQIGRVLADIHTADFSARLTGQQAEEFIPSAVPWQDYSHRAEQQQLSYSELLNNSLARLQGYEKLANSAAELLQDNRVISHRDLDPKNVLWDKSGIPLIIDWEAAGTVHPMQELLEVALDWCGFEAGEASQEAFRTVISAYRNQGGKVTGNWTDVLNLGYQGKLDWLAYSLRRSLGLEVTDEAERQLGVSEVIRTIGALADYADFIPLCLEWLEN
jgi:aminoglycoside phosphotransferase (APT) family kinase protein